MRSDKTKLVVTHIISGDLWAGAEVQVYNLCRALHTSDQVAPTVVTFNDGILYSKLKEIGVPVSLADEKKLGPISIARSIAAHCREQGSKIVHTHGFKENLLGVLGKEMSKVPLSVRTVHGNPETVFTFRRPHKWLIQRLDILLGQLRQQAIIAVSTQLEQRLRRMYPGKVHKIFNFIDVDDIRQQWSTLDRPKNPELHIGFIGRLVPVKRVDLFIHTIKQLNDQGTPSTGIIVGTGPLETKLRELAATLNIESKVLFKGFVNPSLQVLARFDALLMTSDHEGLPMTLLEALALGVPIIAHNTGGIPEVLSFGESGLLVEDHSAAGYAQAVRYTVEFPDQVEAKTRAGVKSVKTQFDKTVQSQKYIDIYHRLYEKEK